MHRIIESLLWFVWIRSSTKLKKLKVHISVCITHYYSCVNLRFNEEYPISFTVDSVGVRAFGVTSPTITYTYKIMIKYSKLSSVTDRSIIDQD